MPPTLLPCETASACSSWWRSEVRTSQVICVALVRALSVAGCEMRRPAKEDFPGRQLVVAGEYAEAVRVLEEYLRKNPKGKFSSRSGLFLGKAYLGLGNFDKSREAFEKTIENHPQSLEAHKSRYKLALLALLRGERVQARRLFRAIADKPDGPLAPEAKAMADYLAHNGGE